MPPQPTPFGILMRQLREERKWSQPQLAKRSGVSAGYIAGIELGYRGKRISRDMVIALARAFDVPPLDLLVAADRDEPNDHQPGTRMDRPDFRRVVMGDPLLKSEEREMLLRLYQSYTGGRRTR